MSEGSRRNPKNPGGSSRDMRAKIDRALKGDAGAAPRGPAKPPRAARPKMGLMTTTLWEYPSQHYDDSLGRSEQGSKDYIGATPSWVIWQLLTRYTREGDRVLDPMCGSGTTMDVCRDLKRRGRGFDLNPTRDDIERADARDLPVDSDAADFVFVDPPYSTHIDYSDDPDCIGKLDAGKAGEHGSMGGAYYVAMEEVIAEMHRVLRPGGHAAIYVSDSFRKGKSKSKGSGRGRTRSDDVFMPIGFELFSILRDYLEPVDLVCVVRHNQKLARGNWHKAAEEENFFLRGFNHLMIARKPG
ncbi:MAG: hypothetical protein DHS20C14_11230 [Phycisphaeraceae bacterium]|nr:MAG: hypothetical protein DHS20C14_11230 [Phycisphaeraceae bacterium]